MELTRQASWIQIRIINLRAIKGNSRTVNEIRVMVPKTSPHIQLEPRKTPSPYVREDHYNLFREPKNEEWLSQLSCSTYIVGISILCTFRY